jgi:hypothetical protein
MRWFSAAGKVLELTEWTALVSVEEYYQPTAEEQSGVSVAEEHQVCLGV